MTFSQCAVEAAVKALYERSETYPKYALRQMNDLLAADLAQAALSAALAVDGVALVPKEPSDDILKAGYESMFDDKYNGTQAPLMYAVWTAMLAAASEWEERK